MKVYKIIDGILNGLLAFLYLIFIVVASSMFKIFPWYDAYDNYLLRMALLWLPLCIFTIIQIAVSLIAKRFDKPLVCLASLNAIYIPVIFLLGFAKLSLLGLKLICILAIITMIIYTVLAFKRLKKLNNKNNKKNKKKNGEKNV